MVACMILTPCQASTEVLTLSTTSETKRTVTLTTTKMYSISLSSISEFALLKFNTSDVHVQVRVNNTWITNSTTASSAATYVLLRPATTGVSCTAALASVAPAHSQLHQQIHSRLARVVPAGDNNEHTSPTVQHRSLESGVPCPYELEVRRSANAIATGKSFVSYDLVVYKGTMVPVDEPQGATVTRGGPSRYFGSELTPAMLPARVRVVPDPSTVGTDVDTCLSLDRFYTSHQVGLKSCQSKSPNQEETQDVYNLRESSLVIVEVYAPSSSAYVSNAFTVEYISNIETTVVAPVSLERIAVAFFMMGTLIMMVRFAQIYFRRRRSRAVEAIDGAAFGDVQQRQNVYQAASAASIHELEVHTEVLPFAPSMYHKEDAVCTICLSEYEPDEDLRLLKCGHHMHKACCDTWLLQKRHCPLCKQDFATASKLIASPSTEFDVVQGSIGPVNHHTVSNDNHGNDDQDQVDFPNSGSTTAVGANAADTTGAANDNSSNRNRNRHRSRSRNRDRSQSRNRNRSRDHRHRHSNGSGRSRDRNRDRAVGGSDAGGDTSVDMNTLNVPDQNQ
jgi:Ring finger domain